MGNNAEIRQRMETCRKVLLALVWIGAIVGMIGGIVMISYETGGGGWYSSTSNPLRPYGIVTLIMSILGGIIGHFLVNVCLAIPFILLNNGDILEALEGKNGSIIASGPSNTSGRTIIGNKIQKICKNCKKEVDEDYTSCPHCGNKTFE